MRFIFSPTAKLHSQTAKLPLDIDPAAKKLYNMSTDKRERLMIMLKLLCGGTGTGKSYAMMERIKERAETGCRVCVVVPDQFTFEYERTLYDHLGCKLFNRGNTEVLSFSRLTRDIFGKMRAPEGDAADPAAKIAVLSTVIKKAAAQGQLDYFGRQAKRPAFANTVSTMLSELIRSGVTPERLAEIISEGGEERISKDTAEKLGDILLIYTDYTRRLAAAGLRDSLFDMRLAAEGAGENGYFDGMCLFMDEFKSFTGDQYDMIRAMLSSCSELTVCMTTDNTASLKGVFASAEETCGSLVRIAGELGVPCEKIYFTENRRYRSECLRDLTKAVTSVSVPVFGGSADEITVISAPDLYAECGYICSEIKALVSDGKYKYNDIAVLSSSMNDDISVLSAHFRRYDIPYYSDKKPSAGHKPLMLMITSALELAAAKSVSSEVLFRYAKTGLAGVTDEEICTLENYCYSWDIDGNMWNYRFPENKDGEENVCEEIKNRLLGPIRALKNNCSDKNGIMICAAVREFIADIDAENALLASAEGNAADAAAAEQMRENRRICEELDNILSSLESAFSEDEIIPLADFREIFMLAAAGITLASPPVALDGVAAQQSDLARLSAVKIVFVMHANDGVFPFIPAASTTFTEAERELFKQAGSDLTGSMKKRLSDERFNAYKAVCAPSDRLYISYPSADGGGKTLYPSEYIEKIKKAFPNCRRIDASATDLLFNCRTEEAAYAAAVENYGSRDAGFLTVRKKLEEDPFYKQRFEYLDSLENRAGAAHAISDPRLMEKLYKGKTINISASRFEDYSLCPFKYYCLTGLKIRPIMKNGLTAINWGNAVHACMKEILEGCGREEFIELDRGRLNRAVIRAVKKYIREEMEGGFGSSAGFPVYLRIMKENTLRALIRLRDELKGSKFTPDAFELSVGGPPRNGEEKYSRPVTITCEDGHSMKFFGTVDRVDTCELNGEKYIRIIDYKTGRKKFSLEELENGINLQMFLYLFSLTDPQSGLYKDHKPAGALYVPVRFPQTDNGRGLSPEEIEEGVFDSLRMSGEILNSSELVNAMERIENGSKGRFIPVEKDENGEYTKDSALLSEEEFEKIKETSRILMKDMCAAVYGGQIPASPLQISSSSTACDLCDYQGICSGCSDITPRKMKKPDKRSRKGGE